MTAFWQLYATSTESLLLGGEYCFRKQNPSIHCILSHVRNAVKVRPLLIISKSPICWQADSPNGQLLYSFKIAWLRNFTIIYLIIHLCHGPCSSVWSTELQHCLSTGLQSKEFKCFRSSKRLTRISYWRDFQSDTDVFKKKYDFQPAQASMVLVLLPTSSQTGLSISKVNHTHNWLQGRSHQLPGFWDDVTDPVNPNNWRSLSGDGQQWHAAKLCVTTVTQHICCKEFDSTSAQRGHKGGLCFT